MFLAWRTHLRAARHASELGRLEEAASLVRAHQLREFKSGAEFAAELAAAYQQRALRRAEEGNFAGAGHDLEQAAELGPATASGDAASRRVARLALCSVEAHVRASDFSAAQQKLAHLPPTALPLDMARTAQEAIRRAQGAHEAQRRGKLANAEQLWTEAAALCPEWTCLAERVHAVRELHAQSQADVATLHKALLEQNWNLALTLADGLLALAPKWRLVQDARQQAWAKTGAKMADSRPSRDTDHWPQIVAKVALPGRAPQEDPGIRFHLWVDAVGGFLCALADEVWLGQAAPGNAIAVPLQAELSRRHAKLRRSGGAYVLEPAHPVSVNGRSSEDKRLLADGDELELGSGVRLRFRQPHPLSATARLEPISRHRLGSGLDAVLLLAESCVMGPNWQNHVVCRDWAGDVVLFRHQERLFCRAREQILIDGVSYEGKGPLTPHSQVAGSDFTFSIELIR